MWMTEVGIVVREISEDAMPLLLMEEEATTQGMQAVSRSSKSQRNEQSTAKNSTTGWSITRWYIPRWYTGWHEGPRDGVGQGAWPWVRAAPSFGNKYILGKLEKNVKETDSLLQPPQRMQLC